MNTKHYLKDCRPEKLMDQAKKTHFLVTNQQKSKLIWLEKSRKSTGKMSDFGEDGAQTMPNNFLLELYPLKL